MNSYKKSVANIQTFPHQREFINSKAKFPALIGGLGSGKTGAGVFRVIKLIIDNKETVSILNDIYSFGIYMPSYSYFRKHLIPEFEKWLTKLGWTFVVNKSEYTITILENNKAYAIIYMISLDKPSSIVSYQMHDSWIDELDIMSFDKAKSSFDQVLERNRAAKMNEGLNTLCVTSTPNGGRNGFMCKTWEIDPKNDVNLRALYHDIRAKTKYNSFLPKDYLYTTFSSYPKKKYLMMAEGQFVDYSKDPVYSEYDRDFNNTNLIWNGEELLIGMDFNANNMSAVVGIVKYIDGIKTLHIIDEIYKNDFNGENIRDTKEMILAIKHRYRNQENNITIYPDAAGTQKTAAAFLNTNIQQLKDSFNVKLNYKTSPARPVNPLIVDRVNTVNGSFKDILQKTVLFVNEEKCTKLVSNLLNQSYVQNSKGEFIPDKTKGHDHMLDALGYLVFYEFSKTYLNRDQTVESRFL